MTTNDPWYAKIGAKSISAMVAGAVLAVLVFPEKLDDLASWQSRMNTVVQSGTTYDPGTHLVILKFWLCALLLLIVTTWVVLLSVFMHAEIRRRMALSETKELRRNLDALNAQLLQANTGKSAKAHKAEKTLKGMMAAAAAIRDKLTPVYTAPSKAVRNVRMVYLIHKDFSTTVTREYEIVAVKDPLHYWGLSNRPFDEADAVDYLDDIDFKVMDSSGSGEVAFLPTVNEPRDKRVTVYFLPRIEPGEPARKIKLSFKWPGFNRRLDTLGQEEIATQLSSAETIESVTIEVYLEQHMHLSGEISGSKYKDSKLETKTHATLGWHGFIYTAREIPAGTHRLAVTAKLERP